MTFATHKTLKSRDTGLGPVTDPVRITRRFIAASSNSADVNKASASVLPRGMPPPVTWQRINMDCRLQASTSFQLVAKIQPFPAYSLHTQIHTLSLIYTDTHTLTLSLTHTQDRQHDRRGVAVCVCERERGS